MRGRLTARCLIGALIGAALLVAAAGARWRGIPAAEAAPSDLRCRPGPAGAPAGAEWAAATPPDVRIVVDLSAFRLDLYVEGAIKKSYPVAIGRPTARTKSPIGEWRVTDKSIEPGGEFGTRWIGLNVPWGSYGIHGTSQPWTIGGRASAGCIRMFNHDVEEVYEWVQIGTPVTIKGEIPAGGLRRWLRRGDVGEDVVYVQLRLDALGFAAEGADGRYGPRTERAVRRLQRLFGLPEDGSVSPDVYSILGFDPPI
ncbi:MAG TPA: L,D-transpeptidase family protein [Limnochordia bacterium]